MAKQTGAIRITGTVGDLTCYKWDGLHCARIKSRLTGKQVKTQPRFRRTMELSFVIGQACVLATGARKFLENQYSLKLPAGFSWRDLDYALQRSATQMLKEGLYSDEVFEELKQLPTAEWLEQALIRKMMKIQKPRKRKSVEFFDDVKDDDRIKDIPPSVLKKLTFRRITDPDFTMDAFLAKYAPAPGKPKQKEIFATACRIGNAVYKQLAVTPANNTLRRKLISDARGMLKEGMSDVDIEEKLLQQHQLVRHMPAKPATRSHQPVRYIDSVRLPERLKLTDNLVRNPPVQWSNKDLSRLFQIPQFHKLYRRRQRFRSVNAAPLRT